MGRFEKGTRLVTYGDFGSNAQVRELISRYRNGKVKKLDHVHQRAQEVMGKKFSRARFFEFWQKWRLTEENERRKKSGTKEKAQKRKKVAAKGKNKLKLEDSYGEEREESSDAEESEANDRDGEEEENDIEMKEEDDTYEDDGDDEDECEQEIKCVEMPVDDQKPPQKEKDMDSAAGNAHQEANDAQGATIISEAGPHEKAVYSELDLD